MNPLLLKGLFLFGLIVFGFGSGWYVKGKFVDAQKYAVDEANKAIDARDFRIAEELETKLQNLKTKEIVTNTYKEKLYEKPIYSASCIDDAGRMWFNDNFVKQRASQSASEVQ